MREVRGGSDNFRDSATGDGLLLSCFQVLDLHLAILEFILTDNGDEPRVPGVRVLEGLAQILAAA